jgi:acetolactate synthase-1/2/3 large subunit
MTAAQAIVEILAAAGIGRLYTVPGESFLGILDATDADPRFSVISCRHESGAAFMAEAEAKLTGVPAVAAGTRGVGAANLAIGVHTAMQDATPMIVLLGQVETGFLGKEAFQEVDLPAFYRPITKWAATIEHASRAPDLVAQAVRRATTGRPGPVMLALPADMLGEDVDAEAVAAAVRAVQGRRAPSVPEASTVTAVADALRAAGQPVLIAGAGCRDARAELIGCAERWNVGVYAAFRRQDVFPNDHPHYLGHLGLGTPAACLDALRRADLVLVVGARLDEITTQGFTLPAPGTRIIHADTDPSVPGAAMPADLALTADARPLLRQLCGAAAGPDEGHPYEAGPNEAARPGRNWELAHGAYLTAATPRRRPAADGLDPAAVIESMLRTLPADTIVTNDAGNFSAFLHLYWRYNEPLTQLAPANGAMGYAVPSGVAAALAAPGRTVAAVCGDGGFLMTGQEIETAVRLGARLIVVVMRNGQYGTIAMHQLRQTGRMSAVTIGEVDIAGLATSLGATGVAVEREPDLDRAFSEAGQRDGVTVLDIRTDPDLTTPALRLSDLRGQSAAEHRD